MPVVRKSARRFRAARWTVTTASLVLAGVALAGCHTMRFEVSTVPHDRVVYDRKAFYFWGLAPTRRVDVAQICPAGVSSIRERTTFTDGLLGFFTLGIYQPRSSWYYCLADSRTAPP